MLLAILYIGSAGIIWYMVWLLLVFNTPADHPRISLQEQSYIETAINEEIKSKQDDLSVKVILKSCLQLICSFTACLLFSGSTTSLETHFNISSSHSNCNSQFLW